MQHFSLICAGYNCAPYIKDCYNSIRSQNYRNLDLYIYDDGSTDNTLKFFKDLGKRNNIHLMRSSKNMGAAYARYEIIQNIRQQDTVCVQLDMDDYLLPNALNTINSFYKSIPDCQMTLGNFRTLSGHNKNRIYGNQTIDKKEYSKYPTTFLAPALRSFRYELVQQMPENIFQDEDGWFKYCTDVPLTFWCLYQCNSRQVIQNYRPLYFYRNTRNDGTLKLSGRKNKVERFQRSLEYFDQRFSKT